MKILLPAVALGLLAVLGAPVSPPQDPDAEALASGLSAGGVELDLDRGTVSISSRVLVRYDLLEYLIVGPQGSAHESLLVTDVQGSVLNAGLLALGVEAGKNAEWVPRDPPPTDEERRAGVDPYDLRDPSGGGFYLYLAWREDGETFLFRMEDLISNLATGRSMRRHRWVYLGSRFGELRTGGGEVFMADAEQNLVNITYFYEGNTLLTGAIPECRDQSIWIANSWIVPPDGSEVRVIFAREPLRGLDPEQEAGLPEVTAPAGGGR